VRQLFAFIFAAVGIGGAVVMFTLKTSEASTHSSGLGSPFGVQHVHPGWATAVGIVFLLAGLVLAAIMLLLPKSGERVEQISTP
jgi:hypothetical protein